MRRRMSIAFHKKIVKFQFSIYKASFFLRILANARFFSDAM